MEPDSILVSVNPNARMALLLKVNPRTSYSYPREFAANTIPVG